MAFIEFVTEPGDQLSDIAKIACKTSQATGLDIHFSFNGTTLYVKPGDRWFDITDQFDQKRA